MAVPLKEKISTVIKLISEPKVLSFLLSQRHTGYLFEKGWFNSYKSNSPVDRNNEPIPWMTYSFIDFINDRLNNQTLFEFGSGNSTLYFSKKVKSVTAVEHNKDWFEKIKAKLPDNSKVVYSETSDEYEKTVSKEGLKFDIIIIDGERRNECMVESTKYISENGIIILDDSERNEYKEGIKHIKSSGYKPIEFWGIAPAVFYEKSTTVFYKDKNCIGV